MKIHCGTCGGKNAEADERCRLCGSLLHSVDELRDAGLAPEEPSFDEQVETECATWHEYEGHDVTEGSEEGRGHEGEPSFEELAERECAEWHHYEEAGPESLTSAGPA